MPIPDDSTSPKTGAAGRVRSGNLPHTKRTLYHLELLRRSQRRGLRPRLPPYKSGAFHLSYVGVEPSTGNDPTSAEYETAVLPIELQGQIGAGPAEQLLVRSSGSQDPRPIFWTFTISNSPTHGTYVRGLSAGLRGWLTPRGRSACRFPAGALASAGLDLKPFRLHACHARALPRPIIRS